MPSFSFEGYDFLTWLEKKKQFLIDNKEAIKNFLTMLLTILAMVQAYYAKVDNVWIVLIAPVAATFIKWAVDAIDYWFSEKPK